jgi:hypothetical protein
MAHPYPCLACGKTGNQCFMTEIDPVEREAEAAAAEAGAIGGRAPEDEDPARRPVEEAGGGESEGFEQAEAMLIERATEWQQSSPMVDRERTDEEQAAFETRDNYGDADEVPSDTRDEEADRGP